MNGGEGGQKTTHVVPTGNNWSTRTKNLQTLVADIHKKETMDVTSGIYLRDSQTKLLGMSCGGFWDP